MTLVSTAAKQALPSQWSTGGGGIFITEALGGAGTGLYGGQAASDENSLLNLSTAVGSTELTYDVNGRLLVNDVNNNGIIVTHEGAAASGGQVGFFGHAAASRTTLTSGTATPEAIAISLQSVGLLGGT